MRNTQNVCITMPHETIERLDQAAEAEKRTRSNLVLVAVDEWLAMRNAVGQQRPIRAGHSAPHMQKGKS
jgi:predicted transcriptional regulator